MFTAGAFLVALCTITVAPVSAIPTATGTAEPTTFLLGRWSGIHIENASRGILVGVEYDFVELGGVVIARIVRFGTDPPDVGLAQLVAVDNRMVKFTATFSGGQWAEKAVEYRLWFDPEQDRLQGWGEDLRTGAPFGVTLERR